MSKWMNLDEFKAGYFLFDPKDHGRIYAFVDFANVRPWAKEFWPKENQTQLKVEIDIAKLYDICSWVKAKKCFFYYGHFPDSTKSNGEHRQHMRSMLRIENAQESGFEVRSKEVKMIPDFDEDGKFTGRIPKCNFDVEIAMDMIRKVEKHDTVLLFSGDSDFAGLLRYLKHQGKKVVVVSARKPMSRELKEVADTFIAAEGLRAFLANAKHEIPLRVL
jgi:uncharacterized LabA/DUF88 family protein